LDVVDIWPRLPHCHTSMTRSVRGGKHVICDKAVRGLFGTRRRKDRSATHVPKVLMYERGSTKWKRPRGGRDRKLSCMRKTDLRAGGKTQDREISGPPKTRSCQEGRREHSARTRSTRAQMGDDGGGLPDPDGDAIRFRRRAIQAGRGESPREAISVASVIC